MFSPEIYIDSAKQNEFIQVSDFIIGSIRRAMQKDFKESEKLLSIFKPIWTIRESLPDNGKHIKPIHDKNDNISLYVCLEEAWRYLSVNEKKIKTQNIKL